MTITKNMPEKEITHSPEEQLSNFVEKESANKKDKNLEMGKGLPETEKTEINQFLERAVDLRDGKGLLAHVTETKSLFKILKHGILSHDSHKELFGSKLPGDGFNPLMQKEYGLDKISLTDGDLYQNDREKDFENLMRDFETLAEQTLLKDKNEEENKGGFEYALWLYNRVGVEWPKILKEEKGIYYDEERGEKDAIDKYWPALKSCPLKQARLFFDFIRIWNDLIIKQLNEEQRQIKNLTDEELISLFDGVKGQIKHGAYELYKDRFSFIRELRTCGLTGARCAVLIDKNMFSGAFPIYDKGAWKYEAMARGCVVPDAFLGLIMFKEDLGTAIKSDESVEQLKRFKIPIYDMSRNMIWPQKITAKEIKNHLTQKNQDIVEK